MLFVVMLGLRGREFSDRSTKYFVVQRTGSSLLFFFFCFREGGTFLYLQVLGVLSLVIKLGSFPFFVWYMKILESLP